MTENAEITQRQRKDSTPLATVERIKSILREYNIQEELHWNQSGVPYCYSNHITLPGTTFHTNGKGLTEELALASAYGELIERLQVGFIYGPTSLKDGDFAIDDPKFDLIPAKELLEVNRNWYQAMADVLLDSTGETITPESLLSQCSTDNGLVSVTPYFDLTTSKKVNFPTLLRKRIYGSNGCAAGNTPEEALVQAISEVVERNHQIRIVKEGLALPEIPDDILKKCVVAYKIVDFVRNNGYKVSIKDASLNTGYPVVCACIIDRRTGRYHTHFGAHPVFEIALERALTESFQGRTIEKIAKNEAFSKKTPEKFTIGAFYSELRRSSGNKLPGFFVDESTFTFDPNVGTSGNNRELLRFCIDHFARRGLSILARDASCLGFPTFQVIVPGYSECYINRLSTKSDDQRYAPYAIKVMRDPSKANIPEMMGLLLHLDRLKALDSKHSDIHNFIMLAKIPSTATAGQQNFLKAASLGYVYHALGHYQQAAGCLDGMLPLAREQDLEYLIALKRYLTLLSEGYTKEYVMKVLNYFHDPLIVDNLASSANPFAGFILHCDKSCPDTCPLFSACCMKTVDSLAAMLDKKLQQLSYDDVSTYLSALQ